MTMIQSDCLARLTTGPVPVTARWVRGAARGRWRGWCAPASCAAPPWVVPGATPARPARTRSPALRDISRMSIPDNVQAMHLYIMFCMSNLACVQILTSARQSLVCARAATAPTPRAPTPAPAAPAGWRTVARSARNHAVTSVQTTHKVVYYSMFKKFLHHRGGSDLRGLIHQK